MIFIFTIIAVVTACNSCLEIQTYNIPNIYVWGTNATYHLIPNTLTTCHGTISCFNAIADIHDLSTVSYTILQSSNITHTNTKSLSVKSNKVPNYTMVYKLAGLDTDYIPISNASSVCWGLLNCNTELCNIKNISKTAFISVSVM